MKRKFIIMTLLTLALLSVCSNPFVNDILPDKTKDDGETDIPVIDPSPIDPSKPVFTIKIDISGDVIGSDDVTASPASGNAGSEITLNYTLNNAKKNNWLEFYGTKTPIESVDTAGTGTKKYAINEEDSTDGVITIRAVFGHSDKTRDSIAFADAAVTKTYGAGSFTIAIPAAGEGAPKGDGAITYSSNDETVAEVIAATGAVTIKKAGTATITAEKAEDDIYSKAEASCVLTVLQLQLTIENPTLTTAKDYDGNTTADITAVGALTNKVEGDTVNVTAAASFASKNAGARQITVVYGIDGASAGNYIKPVEYEIDGTIDKLQLTIANPANITKKYDAGKTATVTAGALSGVVQGDAVTVSAVGTFAQETVADGISITVVYTLGGADMGNYIKPIDYSGTGSITKADGRTVSVPTMASRTENSITIHAVTIQTPKYEQTAEYAISTTASSVPASGWVTTLEFTGLTLGTNYYVFARTAGNANCNEGTAVVSNAIRPRTNDPDRMTVIDFETVISNITNTQGDGTPTVTRVSDPANSGQFSLQIQTNPGGNNNYIYNQAAVVPIYLPYALSNYDSVSFRFRLVSGTESDLTNGRAINVYAAANTSTFVRYGFGNSSGNNFAANLVASTPGQGTAGVGFDDSYKNDWTEYDLTITNPGNAIKDLQGNIYIAIGINHEKQATYLFDDITFLMKDGFDPPPSISPTAASYSDQDITVTMTLPGGKTLTSITNGGSTLTLNTHYSVSGNVVTLNESYLVNLSDGTTTLTFTFSNGTTIPFAITKGLLLKYDFIANNTIDTPGYPKYVANGNDSTLIDRVPASGDVTFSAKIVQSLASGGAFSGKKVLAVEKTNSGSNPRFALPFNLGSGQKLSDYSKIEVVIRGASGDLSWKNFQAQIGTTSVGQVQINFSNSGASTAPMTYEITPNWGALSNTNGEVVIRFGITDNSGAALYEIGSIELK